MDGLAVGSTCYRSPVEAGQAACAAIGGVANGGVVSCEAASLSGRTLSYTLNVDSPSGRESRAVSVEVPQCELHDFQAWQPNVLLWFGALVVLLCARSIRDVFRSDKP